MRANNIIIVVVGAFVNKQHTTTQTPQHQKMFSVEFERELDDEFDQEMDIAIFIGRVTPREHAASSWHFRMIYLFTKVLYTPRICIYRCMQRTRSQRFSQYRSQTPGEARVK